MFEYVRRMSVGILNCVSRVQAALKQIRESGSSYIPGGAADRETAAGSRCRMASAGPVQNVETLASGFCKQLDSPGGGIVVEVVGSECPGVTRR